MQRRGVVAQLRRPSAVLLLSPTSYKPTKCSNSRRSRRAPSVLDVTEEARRTGSREDIGLLGSDESGKAPPVLNPVEEEEGRNEQGPIRWVIGFDYLTGTEREFSEYLQGRSFNV
uniref:Uncharacterized protein n=1 Tax=Lactuca sativa TaxID=4236 RepID=A0A9R1UR81_LACSA|nr:hypothetical protein LSAT_V11C800448800 [Lactuca sativa]